jgi:tRNA-specific 2-thiouridylase
LRLARGVDRAKDQSYVLGMLGQAELDRIVLPIGSMTKADVRGEAARLGLRTAAKPDSQEVCFIASTVGRRRFITDRTGVRPGVVVDTGGRTVGRVDAVELVTLGQRRGLGLPGGNGEPRYVVDVDVANATIVVGERHELLTDEARLGSVTWADRPVAGPVLAQCSAHGEPRPGILSPDRATLRWEAPRPRVAPGQSVVFYVGDEVVGSAIAA